MPSKKTGDESLFSVHAQTSEADTHCILHLEQKVSKCRPVNCILASFNIFLYPDSDQETAQLPLKCISLANSRGKIVLMLDMQHSIWVTSSALVSSSWFWAENPAEESSSLSWILVSVLDVLSNLISSLSQTIQQYFALSKWTMCELDDFPIFF